MKENALLLEGLTVSYGGKPALEGLSLCLEEGAFLTVMGPNGGGKSTLLKAALGLVPPQRGEVRLFGAPPVQKRRLAGYVPQFALMDRRFPISVFDVVLTGRLRPGLHPFFRYDRKDKQAAMEALEQLQIAHLAKRQVAALSGGEFQRLMLARALVGEPAILFLDEPTASVDPASRAHIYALLHGLNQKGMTVVMATHDLMAAAGGETGAVACLNRELSYYGPSVSMETRMKQMRPDGEEGGMREGGERHA